MGKPVKEAKAKHQARGFTEVVERGRGRIRSRKPGTDQFASSYQAGGAGWHFGDGPFTDAHEVDTAWVDADPVLDAPWLKKMVLADYNAYALGGDPNFDAGQIIKYVHPASGEEITFEPQGLYFTNDLDDEQLIGIPQQVPAVVQNEDELLWTDAYASGIDFRWQTQTARLAKFVDIDSLAALGTPEQYILDGGNPTLRIGLIFQKSAGVDIYVDGVLWDEKSNNPQTTLSDVEFRLGGETLWHFKQPFGWQSAPDGGFCPTMRLRAQAQNLFVEILTPWPLLQSAAYPVSIDATIDEQVGASADDGEWREDEGDYDATAELCRVGQHVNTSRRYNTWARFPNITMSGTIDVAYFSLKAWYVSGTLSNVHGKVFAEDAANPSAVTSASDGNGRTRTTAGVDWDPSAWVQNTVYDSPSIVDVIQELVDSYTYSGTQAVQILHDDDGTAATTTWTEALTYDHDSANAPQLHIEYTTGAAGEDFSVSIIMHHRQQLGIR